MDTHLFTSIIRVGTRDRNGGTANPVRDSGHQTRQKPTPYTVNHEMSFRGGFVRSKSGVCSKPCVPVCPVLPTLPDQGGLVPVLWNPSQQASLGSTAGQTDASPLDAPIYTLLVISTQWLDEGLVFRFQSWPSDMRYDDAIASSALAEVDLVLQEAVPPGTVLNVVMRETGCAIWAFSGSKTYAIGGAGIPAAYFTRLRSLLCLSFAPTASGAWTPALGRPMFAIGFYFPEVVSTASDACARVVPTGGKVTAPNFPDQYSTVANSWSILYEVVFPNRVDLQLGSDAASSVCVAVDAIKYFTGLTTHAMGSWSNLRPQIAQPWTILRDNYVSTNNWVYYGQGSDGLPHGYVTPETGPFDIAAMSGQLVPVYFQPRFKDIATDTAPIDNPAGAPIRDSGFAQLGLLVAAPLQPNMAVYFTIDEYDDVYRGFGPRNPLAPAGAHFINDSPSFIWVTGSKVVPAGTVVFIDNIGADAGAITIVNAHDTYDDVGAITYNRVNGQAVTSVIALGTWTQMEDSNPEPKFVCAVLSAQYAGNFPVLAPTVTINPFRFSAQGIYGQGMVFDNTGLPGTVQAPLINSAPFTTLPFGTVVPPASLPTFVGMSSFSF